MSSLNVNGRSTYSPAGHWLARRWSDPTAASKPCLVLVLVLALVVPRARPGPLLAFGTEGRYSRKYLPRGFHSLFRSCSCSFLPFGLQFPPLPTWLLLLLLLHNLTFLTFHFTFAFCLPRLPFLDGSFFDASSAASTITSTPTTAPNVNTLLLIRIRSRRHCYLTRARPSVSYSHISLDSSRLVSSFEAAAPLLGANYLGTRVLRQEGNWAGRNQKKEIDNAPLD
ncbi:hypothetical protein CEP54_010048 [Fusarium duplospermum]|uniref:Uncharacterized protein n=1 Tax=Fusarium duplospermum TaxID=1325734 RepID=A0A428PMD7_9HYPO|nr:hypothetical protein CEP54_010048 [Fusarium duplospermum]